MEIQQRSTLGTHLSGGSWEDEACRNPLGRLCQKDPEYMAPLQSWLSLHSYQTPVRESLHSYQTPVREWHNTFTEIITRITRTMAQHFKSHCIGCPCSTFLGEYNLYFWIRVSIGPQVMGHKNSFCPILVLTHVQATHTILLKKYSILISISMQMSLNYFSSRFHSSCPIWWITMKEKKARVWYFKWHNICYTEC